jgi:hypothetical protein
MISELWIFLAAGRQQADAIPRRRSIVEARAAFVQMSAVRRQIHPGHHAPGRARRWRRLAHQRIVLDVFPQDHSTVPYQVLGIDCRNRADHVSLR